MSKLKNEIAKLDQAMSHQIELIEEEKKYLKLETLESIASPVYLYGAVMACFFVGIMMARQKKITKLVKSLVIAQFK